MIRRISVLIGIALAVPMSSAHAQPSSRELIQTFQQTMATRDFQQHMPLKEFLGLLYEQSMAKGRELPIVLDAAALRKVYPDVADFHETVVKLPPYPLSMTVRCALQAVLAQAPEEITFLIRAGRIDIVPVAHASLKHLLQQRITADFERVPFAEAIHTLSELTGVSIQLDCRLPKDLPLVTATFRNDMVLRDVLRVLADLAGARVTELETGVIVTAVGETRKSGK